MTDASDPPTAWRDFAIKLTRSDRTGIVEGFMTVEDRSFGITDWRNDNGTVRGRITLHGPDPWLDDWLERLTSRVAG